MRWTQDRQLGSRERIEEEAWNLLFAVVDPIVEKVVPTCPNCVSHACLEPLSGRHRLQTLGKYFLENCIHQVAGGLPFAQDALVPTSTDNCEEFLQLETTKPVSPEGIKLLLCLRFGTGGPLDLVEQGPLDDAGSTIRGRRS